MPAKPNPPKIQKPRAARRRRSHQAGEPTAIDLIEEGVHLLRRTSLAAWGVYFCGVCPFLLGFLFFWMEMVTSGYARQSLLPASLGLGLLFIWLKVTQCFFARGLREALLGHPEPTWGFGTWWTVFRRQAIWQPTGLILLPVAVVLTVPFAWAFAFYQNLITADPLEREAKARDLISKNWSLARMWHEQNWLLLSLLSLVAFLSWLNWITMAFFGPFLLKSLLGVETVFSKAGLSLLNSTLLFGCGLLAFLVTDPLVKAVYLLRRHYAASRRSGADLRLRLRRYALRDTRIRVSSLLLLVTVGLLGLWPGQGVIAQTTVDAPAPIIDTEYLDRTIDQVLERREFVWRFPRDEVDGEPRIGWYVNLLERLEALQERIERWIEEFFGKEKKSNRSLLDGLDLGGLGSFLSYLIIGGFVLLVLLLAWRAWRMYQLVDVIEGQAESGAVAQPDLEDEGLSADLLPRNEWVDLAREWIAKGDYRLALRAYFLAQLSAFSSEGLILIRKAKSNREYARELSRRGHGNPRLLDLYWSELRLFERVWYGDGVSGPEEVREMESYLTEQGVLG